MSPPKPEGHTRRLSPDDAPPEESRPRLMQRSANKRGLPPGSLVYVGKPRCADVTIHVIDYSEDAIEEHHDVTVSQCGEFLNASSVTWINVVGLHETSVIEEMGNLFNIHPLVLEDVLNTSQRPKTEQHSEYVFLQAKMLYRDNKTTHVVSEQVSIVLGSNYVLSFQEVPQDVFNNIRERIRESTGRVRSAGCDYLAYALLDAMVDNYYVMLEDLDDRIDDLHERVLKHADTATLQEIHGLRREMVFIRKLLWPFRELVNELEDTDTVLIAKETRPYLRDVYEHLLQIMDNMEALRDMLTSALEIHLSLTSNRMNDVMRVLTVIATIFIPLTFIAGIYGMNFQNMPELNWQHGYQVAWGAMIVTAVGMIIFFRRRNWL